MKIKIGDKLPQNDFFYLDEKNEVKKIYETYGYNDVEISFYEQIYNDTNTVDLYFEFNEGKITKIDNIIFITS